MGQVVMWHVVACRRRPAAPSDLPKSGGAAAPPAPALGASLHWTSITLSRNSTASILPFVAACINGVRPKRSLDSTFAPPAQNVESRMLKVEYLTILADHLSLSQPGGGQIISPLRIFRSSYGPEFY